MFGLHLSIVGVTVVNQRYSYVRIFPWACPKNAHNKWVRRCRRRKKLI
jgi:hypothetical protein